jgi:hypothetical protein
MDVGEIVLDPILNNEKNSIVMIIINTSENKITTITMIKINLKPKEAEVDLNRENHRDIMNKEILKKNSRR